MSDRRRAARKRVIYGAKTSQPGSDLRIDCVVKNCSDDGAQVDFRTPKHVADQVALSVPQQGKAYHGRVVWANGRSAGIAFTQTSEDAQVPAGDLTEELRKTKRKARLLQRRVEQLLGQD